MNEKRDPLSINEIKKQAEETLLRLKEAEREARERQRKLDAEIKTNLVQIKGI